MLQGWAGATAKQVSGKPGVYLKGKTALVPPLPNPVLTCGPVCILAHKCWAFQRAWHCV